MTLLIAGALLAELLPARLRPSGWPRLQLALPVAAALIFQLHAWLEGPRRELLPLYSLGLAVLAWAGARMLQRGPDGSAAHTSRLLDGLLALGGLALIGWTWVTVSPG